jgi:hypothetical protein
MEPLTSIPRVNLINTFSADQKIRKDTKKQKKGAENVKGYDKVQPIIYHLRDI